MVVHASARDARTGTRTRAPLPHEGRRPPCCARHQLQLRLQARASAAGARIAHTHLEQVVARHARLARHTGGDDDEVAALERLAELVVAFKALLCVNASASVARASGERAMSVDREEQACRTLRRHRDARTPTADAQPILRTWTLALVLTWLTSAATPSVLATSKSESAPTCGFI